MKKIILLVLAGIAANKCPYQDSEENDKKPIGYTRRRMKEKQRKNWNEYQLKSVLNQQHTRSNQYDHNTPSGFSSFNKPSTLE
jgi:hypothetical protein